MVRFKAEPLTLALVCLQTKWRQCAMKALSTFIGVRLVVTPNTAIFPETRMTVKSLRALNVVPQFYWNGMGGLCLRSIGLQANSSYLDQPRGRPMVTIVGRQGRALKLPNRAPMSYCETRS